MVLALLLLSWPRPPSALAGQVGGCPMLPPTSAFNTPIDTLPVHAKSQQWMQLFPATRKLHPDFGTFWEDDGEMKQMGIPFNVVPSSQPLKAVEYSSLDGWPEESDAGPMPIPHLAAKEKPDVPDGDSHVLVIRQGECKLYELYHAKENPDQTWSAMSGAVFDSNSNRMRTTGWTSADAAGFPITPLLVRRDELYSNSGEVDHCYRVTLRSSIIKSYVWPASHKTSGTTDGPPYGTRFRLKASYSPPSSFPAAIQKFVRALKKYGLIVADGGSDFYVSGTHDPDWNDSELNYIKQIPVSEFEVVDASSLMITATSYEATSTTGPAAAGMNSTSPAHAQAPSRGATAVLATTVAAALTCLA